LLARDALNSQSERGTIAQQAVAEIRNLPEDPWKLAEQLTHDWSASVPDYRGGSTPDG
jgi:hypothetical protein